MPFKVTAISDLNMLLVLHKLFKNSLNKLSITASQFTRIFKFMPAEHFVYL